MVGSLYPLLSSVHSMVSFEIFLSGTFVSTSSCVPFMNLWVYFYIHFMFTMCQVLLFIVQSLNCVPTLCYPINCSTPGFLVLHYLSEFAQTVHWVGDVTQPSYLLSPIFPPALNLGASASVLAVNIQDWFPLGLTGLISLQFKGLSRVFSSTTVWKHQFFSTQPSLWSDSHLYMFICIHTHIHTFNVVT